MRDYSKPPPKKTPKRASGGGLWLGLVMGLSLGVIGSAGFYWVKLRPQQTEAKLAQPPIPQSAADEVPAKEAANPNKNYTFYDQLKSFSVKIPDKETESQRDLKPNPETRPGSYILQAGSYQSIDEADHKRAQLALLGIEAHVQTAVYENEKYYRVKIGPIQNLEQLNKIRENLRRNHVDVVTARVSD